MTMEDARLIQKHSLQLTLSVKTPPRRGPTTDETAKTAPNRLKGTTSVVCTAGRAIKKDDYPEKFRTLFQSSNI